MDISACFLWAPFDCWSCCLDSRLSTSVHFSPPSTKRNPHANSKNPQHLFVSGFTARPFFLPWMHLHCFLCSLMQYHQMLFNLSDDKHVPGSFCPAGWPWIGEQFLGRQSQQRTPMVGRVLVSIPRGKQQLNKQLKCLSRQSIILGRWRIDKMFLFLKKNQTNTTTKQKDNYNTLGEGSKKIKSGLWKAPLGYTLVWRLAPSCLWSVLPTAGVWSFSSVQFSLELANTASANRSVPLGEASFHVPVFRRGRQAFSCSGLKRA